MKILENVNGEDLLFIDIETVSSVKTLVEGTQLYEAWKYKARYGNELNKKTGEVYSIEEFYESKAALYAPFAKIACITIGKIKSEKIYLKTYSGDEKTLLKDFNNDTMKFKMVNPKISFCGLNNIGFDEPFILKRMVINGIKPNELIDCGESKPWLQKSIDLGKIFQGTSFYPDSLIAIATALGLPSPKDAIDGSQVTEAFYNGRIADIITYCEKDVTTTINIFRKFKFQEVITDIIIK